MSQPQSAARPTRAWSRQHHETEFRDAVNSIRAAYERSRPGEPRYKKVAVLSLKWSNDDLNLGPLEADLLRVFRDTYHFVVQTHVIDITRNFLRELINAINDFANRYDDPASLLILYYSGHGDTSGPINNVMQMHWFGNLVALRVGVPRVDWADIEGLFRPNTADTLIFMDCSNAALAGAGMGTATHEMICASGWEHPATGVHVTTFTKRLIEHLKSLNGEPQAVSQIFAEMFHKANSTQGWLEATPVYIPAHNKESITLAPVVPPHARMLAKTNYVSKDKVLMSVSFKDYHGKPDADNWKKWLEQAPPEIRDIKFDAVYQANSVVALFTIPFAVWLQLEDHPAWNFVSIIVQPDSILEKTPLPIRPAESQPSTFITPSSPRQPLFPQPPQPLFTQPPSGGSKQNPPQGRGQLPSRAPENIPPRGQEQRGQRGIGRRFFEKGGRSGRGSPGGRGGPGGPGFQGGSGGSQW